MKRKYGLVGYPLGHSFSRSFFQQKFEDEHINATYENFEIQDISCLRQLISDNHELCGLNVTIPHKTTVIPYSTNCTLWLAKSERSMSSKLRGKETRYFSKDSIAIS